MLQGYKTYVGIAVVLISFIAQKFGYTVEAGLLSEFLHASLNDAGVIIGGIFAWWGRAKAYKTFISKR